MKESQNLKMLLDAIDEHGLYRDINLSVSKTESGDNFIILGGIEDYTKLHRIMKNLFKNDDSISMEKILDVKFAFLKLIY